MPYMFIWILSALYIYEFLWNVHIYIFIQAYMAIQDLRVPSLKLIRYVPTL